MVDIDRLDPDIYKRELRSKLEIKWHFKLLVVVVRFIHRNIIKILIRKGEIIDDSILLLVFGKQCCQTLFV